MYNNHGGSERRLAIILEREKTKRDIQLDDDDYGGGEREIESWTAAAWRDDLMRTVKLTFVRWTGSGGGD